MTTTYTVQIIRDATGEIVREVECGDNRAKAERVERGVLINLNHAEYHTIIKEAA